MEKYLLEYLIVIFVGKIYIKKEWSIYFYKICLKVNKCTNKQRVFLLTFAENLFYFNRVLFLRTRKP
jgi:hypothetical protein